MSVKLFKHTVQRPKKKIKKETEKNVARVHQKRKKHTFRNWAKSMMMNDSRVADSVHENILFFFGCVTGIGHLIHNQINSN